ncbi:3,4-dihydroxy-2-butanone-4-phosphate synthase [Hazenella sp. IB182357]|uniref:3,4-dihydroxy-2-butanone 4-phosphate synthase n=1 Tax=Polycladospora coralii TaxID=2771432 RepID=A0A926N6R7_9BACL|nr:3,4-dihydroxy-2-butanone-4-phosphate synthase [Polycladospora coralii]MBD1373504.1 3,4-dihydroxy-2-butanone-4-phosphate synthase [Polycladospora coralii]
MKQSTLNKVEMAIKAVKNGEMVIIQDDQSRENEGDLVFAAEFVTPEHVNFMAMYGRGLICVPMLAEQLQILNLPQMVEQNEEAMRTAFTVSVDAIEGVHTGISAHERSLTIQALANPTAKATDFVRPGHIFPLCARPNGVFERRGQTEASIDLMRLAQLNPVAVICEIMNDDGTMARRSDLELFSNRYQMPLLTIEEICVYRQMHN